MSESKDSTTTTTAAAISGDGEKNTIATDIVVTKYKMAGEMVNRKFLAKFFSDCLIE